MVSAKKRETKEKNRGMFLFFLSGMFLLQIVFAFTIHGDIGPQAALNTSCQAPASPLLMGRIDTILSAPNQTETARMHPMPISEAPAPVVKPREVLAREQATLHQPTSPVNQGRFAEYTVQRGDTLERISRKLCGTTSLVSALVRLNRLSNERGLQCGARLRVPRTLMAKK
ncbi:MAG TPA: LysM peptidoglycan-binding domain-containing protein [Candidatus Ozemobacteraceae bacterium]|nr:LysM peptidoglycan-binding domain-containing protein [Candidatus Ozemobacteraceae bacterium]